MTQATQTIKFIKLETIQTGENKSIAHRLFGCCLLCGTPMDDENAKGVHVLEDNTIVNSSDDFPNSVSFFEVCDPCASSLEPDFIF
jgi:hypothetical protein